MSMLYALAAVLCALFAALFAKAKYNKSFVRSAVYKALASLCFVSIGFGAVLSSESAGGAYACGFVCAGLSLGFFADILLSLRYMSQKHWKKLFAAGTGVFLAGHISYICALMPFVKSTALCAAAASVLGICIMRFVYRRTVMEKFLRLFGGAYIVIISLAVSCSLFALFSQPCGFTALFAAGAVCFMASDILLILNNFGARVRLGRKAASTALYYAAQLMIAFSLLLYI